MRASTPASLSSSRPALTAGLADRGTTISSTRRTESLMGGLPGAALAAACMVVMIQEA